MESTVDTVELSAARRASPAHPTPHTTPPYFRSAPAPGGVLNCWGMRVAAFTVRKQINELGADKAGTSMPQASQVQLLLCRVTADELRRVMVCRSAARGEAKEPVGRPVEHARVFVLVSNS